MPGLTVNPFELTVHRVFVNEAESSEGETRHEGGVNDKYSGEITLITYDNYPESKNIRLQNTGHPANIRTNASFSFTARLEFCRCSWFESTVKKIPR